MDFYFIYFILFLFLKIAFTALVTFTNTFIGQRLQCICSSGALQLSKALRLTSQPLAAIWVSVFCSKDTLTWLVIEPVITRQHELQLPRVVQISSYNSASFQITSRQINCTHSTCLYWNMGKTSQVINTTKIKMLHIMLQYFQEYIPPLDVTI